VPEKKEIDYYVSEILSEDRDLYERKGAIALYKLRLLEKGSIIERNPH